MVFLSDKEISIFKKFVDEKRVKTSWKKRWYWTIEPSILFNKKEHYEWFMTTCGLQINKISFSKSLIYGQDITLFDIPFPEDYVKYLIEKIIVADFLTNESGKNTLIMDILSNYSIDIAVHVLDKYDMNDITKSKQIWIKYFKEFQFVQDIRNGDMSKISIILQKNLTRLIHLFTAGYINPDVVSIIPKGILKAICFGKDDGIFFKSNGYTLYIRFNCITENSNISAKYHEISSQFTLKNGEIFPKRGINMTLHQYIKNYDDTFDLPDEQSIEVYRKTFETIVYNAYEARLSTENNSECNEQESPL